MTETTYVLKCISPDFTSYGRFKWPDKVGGVVEAPDWDPQPKCGGGLHGWLHGEGDSLSCHWTLTRNAIWMVLEVSENSIVDLEMKVKFPKAEIKFIGDRVSCAMFLLDHDPEADPATVLGAEIIVPRGKHGVGGALSQVDGENSCILVGGPYSRLRGGYGCTFVGHDCSKVIGGRNSSVMARHMCQVEVGNFSRVNALHECTVKGGRSCKITGGIDSHLAGGDKSVLVFLGDDRSKTVVVGKNGIEPGVFYQMYGDHGFGPVPEEAAHINSATLFHG